MKPESKRALELAEGDLVMAGYARRRKLHEQCVFHCHQALEKILKAIWEERASEGSPPRTHNIASLALQLFPDLRDEDLRLLERLARQYLPSRYVEYETVYSEQDAATYYRRSREIFAWLRQQLS